MHAAERAETPPGGPGTRPYASPRFAVASERLPPATNPLRRFKRAREGLTSRVYETCRARVRGSAMKRILAIGMAAALAPSAMFGACDARAEEGLQPGAYVCQVSR